MTDDILPFLTLFKNYIPDLGPADDSGWAIGSCPFCREAGTFRVNLNSGRWVCLPTPQGQRMEGNQ